MIRLINSFGIGFTLPILITLDNLRAIGTRIATGEWPSIPASGNGAAAWGALAQAVFSVIGGVLYIVLASVACALIGPWGLLVAAGALCLLSGVWMAVTE